MIALHSTRVGDRGTLSDGMWTLTVLSLIVTTRSDCPKGTPCLPGEDGIGFNEKACGELKFECFSCECCDFVFALLELLGFGFVLLADKGGVDVALTTTAFFPDPCLEHKIQQQMI